MSVYEDIRMFCIFAGAIKNLKFMKEIGYIYLTTNLVNGKQYVGQHLATEFDKKYKGSGTIVNRAFEKYGWDNFKCEVICWCSTQTQLNEAEDNYIKLLDTMSPNGYNLKGGGANGKYSKKARENCRNSANKHWESEENRKKHSEVMKDFYKSEKGKNSRKKQIETINKFYESETNHEKLKEVRKKFWESEKGNKTKIKISETSKGRTPWNKGKKCENISKSKMGFKFTENSRKKMSISHINNPKTTKKVYQYTLDGKFVKEWCSLNEIGRVLGYDTGGISYCCNNKQKSAYNHLWSYNNNEEVIKKKLESLNTRHKNIYQYTLNGEFIKEWKTLSEISNELGFYMTPISDCCKGKTKSAYKFIWTFEPLTKELITFPTSSLPDC